MARSWYVNMWWWHMNTRVLGIKFKPGRRNEMVELTKCFETARATKWILTIIKLTKIYRFLLWKFVHFERSVVIFAYRWPCKLIIFFCCLGISRVQQKSNWTVSGRLLASDREAVKQCRLILLKVRLTL